MSKALQYLLGLGITGVFVTQIATSVRAWLERSRERDGLLRVLFAEVNPNRRSIELVLFVFELAHKGNAKAIGHAKTVAPVFFAGMRTEAWRDTRVQLAHSLSSKEFATLASYYQALMGGKQFVDNGVESDEARDTVRLLVKRLHGLGREVDQIIRTYAPDVVDDELTDEDLVRLGYSDEDLKRLR
jgi:hypothetical protein